MLTGVFAEGLGENWLGRELDENAVKELLELQKKSGLSPVGEGGEFESAVIDCPLFKKKIQLIEKEKVWDKKTSSGYLVVEGKLVEK